MARLSSTLQNFKSIAAAANVALGLMILFGTMDRPAALLINVLGTAEREALKLLPYLAPGIWQVLQTHALDHQWFSACPVETLVSFWPLLHVVAGAA